jgi:hypothetical protein
MFQVTDTAMVVTDLRHKEVVAKAERRAQLEWDEAPSRIANQRGVSRFDGVKSRLFSALRRPAVSLPASS